MSEIWIVDLRDWGTHFLKTESGRVICEGLSQKQACQLANEHNGDQAYPIPTENDS